MTTDRVAGAALLALALAVAAWTRPLPLGSVREPGPGFLPLLLAALLAGLALLVAATGGRSTPLRALRWDEWRHAVAILAGCAFAALALERLGYRLTMIVLVAFLVGVVERKGGLATAAVALGLALGAFFLFANLLKVPLPRGPFGF